MTPPKTDLLQGTLDLPILKALEREAKHGRAETTGRGRRELDAYQPRRGGRLGKRVRGMYGVAVQIGLFASERQAEAEYDDELRFHLEMKEHDNPAAGMPPDEGRRESGSSFWQPNQSARELPRIERDLAQLAP